MEKKNRCPCNSLTDAKAAREINEVLPDYSSCIRGRMGLPSLEEGQNMIFLIL
ncbi:MAG: hypothetical protein WCS73_01150 [Lentisphaeria bacterium]